MSSGAAPALGSPAQGGSPLLSFLRAHPLSGYFLLAYAFTWAWLIPMLAIFHQQVAGPWLVLCPTAVGFVMAGIVEGREGMLRLLRRVLVWRVGISWYLVSLLLFPALMLISLAVLPGATAAFRLPDTSFLATYLLAFVFAFFSAGAIEEFGWRGFALPRLQARYGPLLGTLLLGALWGFWHLPLRVLQTDLEVADGGLAAQAAANVLYIACVAASAFLYTWVSNHSRGSLLLVTLLHASTNAAGGTFPTLLFPALFPSPVIPTSYEIGMLLLSALVVVATRGRLGYDRYLRDVAPSAVDRAVAPDTSTASAP